MTLSYSLENCLSNFFVEKGRVYNPDSSALYENNKVFQKFLEITIPYSGECFIPVVSLSNTISLLHEWFSDTNATHPIKISYPLSANRDELKRTGDAILQSIGNCPKNARLTYIRTLKDVEYYGGHGLIFDSKWTPIMLCGFIVNIDKANTIIQFIKPVCYVAPYVFTSNDIVSKAIIKKAIPFFATGIIHFPPSLMSPGYITFNSDYLMHAHVTIENIDKYFVTPKEPSNSEIVHLNDNIWTFLEKNVRDLI